jgi:SP family myo-inositol transporter-like MFS transporter 13
VRAEAEDKTTPYLIFLIAIVSIAGFPLKPCDTSLTCGFSDSIQAAIAGFLFGYDTGIVGAALPLVGEDLGHKLSDPEMEIITAATTIGAFFGALVLGFLADKLGRKWSMTIADIL